MDPTTTPTRQRLVLAGLLLLALVPAIAGVARLGGLATGAPVTPETARFALAPVPIALHVVAALLYSVLGAFQLVPAVRRRHVRRHRRVGGLLLVPAGLVVAATGIWMTASYAVPATDAGALAAIRHGVGGLMAAFLLLGVRAIARRDVVGHGAWMIRAYALGTGAGTQVLTHAPFLVLVGQPDRSSRAALMAAGWLINAVVAEAVIARRRTAHARRRPAAAVA